MATSPGRTTRPGRVRRAAVRRADCDRRGARPCLIGGIVDCRPTVGASPGSACGITGTCDPAIFHANAKITPTSTGPTVEASPAPLRVPGSDRGLDSRRTPSFLRTETQRTSALSSAGWRHPKVIFHLVVVDPAGKAERSAESRLKPGRRSPTAVASTAAMAFGAESPEKRSFRPNGHGSCPGTGTGSRLEYPLFPKSLPASDVY